MSGDGGLPGGRVLCGFGRGGMNPAPDRLYMRLQSSCARVICALAGKGYGFIARAGGLDVFYVHYATSVRAVRGGTR